MSTISVETHVLVFGEKVAGGVKRRLFLNSAPPTA